MIIKNISDSIEYIVYIIYENKEKFRIHFSNDVRTVFNDQSAVRLCLVYFEKFSDRSKAVRRKKHLDGLMDDALLKLIKKRNPEMLNLIFTIHDNYIFK